MDKTEKIASASQRRPSVFLRAALIFGALVATVTVWILMRPPPVRPTLSIQLASYTNDAGGGGRAILFLRNDSPTTIYAYQPLTVMQSETNWQMVDTFPARIPWGETLPPGRSATLATPVPTNGVSWKLHLYVYNDLDTARVIKRYLTLRRQMPFFIDSNWFEPPPN